MRKLVSKRQVLLLAGLLVAIGMTVPTVSSQTEAVVNASCRCPLYYAPVICDHNKTYPNPCVADCHNAKNCVPTGGI